MRPSTTPRAPAAVRRRSARGRESAAPRGSIRTISVDVPVRLPRYDVEPIEWCVARISAFTFATPASLEPDCLPRPSSFTGPDRACPDLPVDAQPHFRAAMPVRTDLQSLFHRSGQQVRGGPRVREGTVADLPVQPVGGMRPRPSVIDRTGGRSGDLLTAERESNSPLIPTPRGVGRHEVAVSAEVLSAVA